MFDDDGDYIKTDPADYNSPMRMENTPK